MLNPLAPELIWAGEACRNSDTFELFAPSLSGQDFEPSEGNSSCALTSLDFPRTTALAECRPASGATRALPVL
jgi:hypothetical protein